MVRHSPWNEAKTCSYFTLVYLLGNAIKTQLLNPGAEEDHRDHIGNQSASEDSDDDKFYDAAEDQFDQDYLDQEDKVVVVWPSLHC